jgi:hypothetical protein
LWQLISLSPFWYIVWIKIWQPFLFGATKATVRLGKSPEMKKGMKDIVQKNQAELCDARKTIT